MEISVIVCTKNRHERLAETLASIRAVEIPAGAAVELVVVDNGSTDDTAGVVVRAGSGRFPIHHVVEPEAGQARARNTGIRYSSGEIILFTDDDVRLPPDWLASMCKPIVSGVADAVAGGVRLCPTLQRPWMLPLHRTWLSENAPSSQDELAGQVTLVGASMGFARRVLDSVPGFDENLGPGALGFADDSFFTTRLKDAGFRIAFVAAYVEHIFEPERLTRVAFEQAASGRGRSSAYIAHHWEGRRVYWARLRLLRQRTELLISRLCNTHETSAEGMAELEMHWRWSIAFFDQYLKERRKPRAYRTVESSGVGSSELAS